MIKKRSDAILFLFFFLLSFTTFASAGYITIETRTTATLTDSTLKVTVDVKNNGNEPAYNVEITANAENNTRSSKVKDILNVSETFKADFDFNLDLKYPGRYPLVIAVNYTDANQYPFSAISCSNFYYKENVIPQVFAKSAELTMSKNGELFLNIKNLTKENINLNIRLIISKELSAEVAAKKITLEGRAEKEVKFAVNNFSALPGSNYQVYAILEYDDSGKHYSTAIPGIVKIEKEGIFFQKYKIFIIIAAGILIALFLIYQFRPKAKV
ncbi:MAG: hypothetical protein A2042_02505 [Candidatus Schekmanbacteria bacterium GWA2_38_11]|uniref:CARDB domain-containing protein n=1 Tax=Candidatus Schekmanbacteria bacterium GWA2_38_11 TaxID=1817876 RepID=A0A1F7RMR9_9BACT|nr:MAG: hypothetical protein A2042_02505 [Candidatus Schekmanbacteria bacterium GWA2_38_11]